ncbi:MAG: hypothetical protein A2X12_02415 [Bacteroidetes bacterium GWE2_29_8]|nr:MAG: hypothetical protein A2X12_02415 [Bacteroidetes bacterium GWE2_29_8]OFY14621.1 MAG: hypothetical protein A2X02_06005 [Bacteroidetes bacterium GWF2_29_10]
MFCNVSFAQEANDVINQFFKTYEGKGYEAGVDYLLSTNKKMQSDSMQTANIKNLFKASVSEAGNYSGNELIKKEEVSASLIKYTYLLKYENDPINVILILYKAKDKWSAYNINCYKYINEEARNQPRSMPNMLRQSLRR